MIIYRLFYIFKYYFVYIYSNLLNQYYLFPLVIKYLVTMVLNIRGSEEKNTVMVVTKFNH